ncbi:MAG: metal ABC transporter substrate-binding protein [Treponemataceae bacterium]|nr:metal ABC transporter substrate-binding protein [Treponemataceae bacterium]
MKKNIIQLFIFLVLITLFLTGCKKENTIDENSISIVATNFPAYDFARSVVTKVDENYLAPINNFTNVNIKLLIKPGMETHSFDPTPKDIIDIQNADIFIYMGGHSEAWVEKILATSNKLPKKIIKLKDVVEISDNHQHHETEHNHNEHEEDEHFWTDSKNAIKMISNILENIIEIDNEKTSGKYIEEYKSNANSYINKISNLSTEIKNTVDNSSNKLLIFGDRFPFTYFTEEYDLDYVATFDGCSSAVEAKTSTIAELINIAKNTNAKAIFKIEMSNGKIAQTIADATGAKILELHSCQNVTKDDFNRGVTYAYTMKSNLEAIKEGL